MLEDAPPNEWIANGSHKGQVPYNSKQHKVVSSKA
jgi:hypothetical protein